MRRTMESVAAERLNKIGKNPSIVSTRADFQVSGTILIGYSANAAGSQLACVDCIDL
jgi:hypothetical protein